MKPQEKSKASVGINAFATAAFLLLVTSNCVGADLETNKRSITIIGYVTCADWLEARKEEQKGGLFDWTNMAANKMWLIGFLSGLNAAYDTDKDILEAIDSETAVVWTDRYCKLNPKKSLSEGGQALFNELLNINK